MYPRHLLRQVHAREDRFLIDLLLQLYNALRRDGHDLAGLFFTCMAVLRLPHIGQSQLSFACAAQNIQRVVHLPVQLRHGKLVQKMAVSAVAAENHDFFKAVAGDLVQQHFQHLVQQPGGKVDGARKA